MRTIGSLVLVASFATPAFADSKSRTHDGFHLQVTGGFGYYSSSASDSVNEVTYSGMTLPASLLMGGTLFGRMAFGGGVMIDTAPAPTYEVNGMEPAGTPEFNQYVVGLGLYVDYYLDPKKNGLHIQAFGGWGGLETSTDQGAGGSDPTGLFVAGGVGYEWWLSHEWSGGVMLRFTYGPFDLNGTSYSTIAPAVVGTLTWH
jgi:hypothetical protein